MWGVFKPMKRTTRHASPYLTCLEAAELLRVSPRTLEKLRLVGGGPRFRKFGRRVLYAVNDLESWSNSRACVSTSDATYRHITSKPAPEIRERPVLIKDAKRCLR